MDSDQQLSHIRERIDEIDLQLLELISERAQCAQQVAEVKLRASQAQEEAPVFYRPERE
ncbi:MAG: chorismate mutase, partial [Halieaceae bacterium]